LDKKLSLEKESTDKIPLISLQTFQRLIPPVILTSNEVDKNEKIAYSSYRPENPGLKKIASDLIHK